VISLLNAKGVFPILATPFNDDGSLDLESLERLTDFSLATGASGLTVLGIMGEANKLTADESRVVMRTVLDRRAGKPVIVGASTTGVQMLAAFAKEAMSLGASGIMLSPPTGLRTDEAIERYFEDVFSAMPDVPVVLQDYPQNSAVYLSAPTIRRLFERWPMLHVLKLEDVPGLRKLSRLRRDEDDGVRRITILVGNSAMHLPQELRRGADGANTGVAFPEMLVSVCAAFATSSDDERGEDLYDAFLPLIRHEQQAGIGIAIRKEILRRRALIRCARVRAPGPSLDRTDHAELSSLLTRLRKKLIALRSPLAEAIPGN
jgi:4-hydroxy-tetrahydrodipicolinate synthase